MRSPFEISRERSVVLWLLLPTLAAYTVCELGFGLENNAARLVASLIAGTLATLSFFARKNARQWALFFCGGIFFAAGTWWSLRAPVVLEIGEKFPESEIQGTIVIEKTFRSGGKNWTGLARMRQKDAGVFDNTRVFYMIPKKRLAVAPVENDRIAIDAVLSPWHTQTWIPENFLDYLQKNHTSFALTRIVPAGEPEEQDWRSRHLRFCKKIQSVVSERLVALGGRARERESDVLVAMMFGERGRLPEIEKENFQLTGTMHIFAVSGLHVAIVALLLSWAGTALRLRERPRIFLILLLSWAYVQLAGGVPSATRAWMMICFYYVGKSLGRGNYTVPAIALVALLNLWMEPRLLRDLGFQLSYSVVIGIFLYGIPLEKRLLGSVNAPFGLPGKLMAFPQRIFDFLRRHLIGSFAISFTAFLATSLLLASIQGIFTPLSIVCNILLVPVVGLALPLALVAAVFCFVPAGTAIAAIFWAAACRLAFFCEWFTGLLAHEVGALEFPIRPAWLAPLGAATILASFFVAAEWRVLRERPFLRFGLPVFIFAYFLICSSLF
ncbi:MAG: ComEC/Rec2 family competence protein [Opitutales bacterium]|nr:ComEC/Rec2 family competence protein [Opitutales bacterium]